MPREWPERAVWQRGLPELVSPRVRLREVCADDAPDLYEQLTAPEVIEFVPPPPATVEGFERFAAWAREGRACGSQLCFSVVSVDDARASGIMAFQLPPPGYDLWNWGFALGMRSWGKGIFREAAALALGFAAEHMGLDEVEAWILHANGRANSAVSKLGAVPTFIPDAHAPDGRTGDFMRWTVKTSR